MATPFSITLDGSGPVSALDYPAAPETAAALGTTLILAHGAGAPQTHPFMTAFAHGLSTRGVRVVTFNFPYMERGRRVPDPPARLEACYRTAIAEVRKRQPDPGFRLFAGGKSMGGRIASQVIARDTGSDATLGVDGLVLLGYPLHPPGRPEKLRSAHLPSITVPILVVQGSRDAFGTPDELRPAFAGCVHADLFVVDGGDHSFRVRGKNAPTEAEIRAAIQDGIIEWCGRHPLP